MQQEPTNDTASAGAVYVQTNAAPNELIAFRRADDGSLDLIGSVATGGEGDGTPHLQSQGSVTLTSDGQYLLVTNAASDDLSVFRVHAEGIERVEGGDQALDTSDADPAQVAFSPDGSMVVITQRGTDSIVAYEVTADGTFGASSEVASEGPTPYGFAL